MLVDKNDSFRTLQNEELFKLPAEDEFSKPSNTKVKSNLKGDRGNFALLIFLYLLQGLPVLISLSIPLILQMRGALYNEQAGFSLVMYPFVLKLLWAPIVDSFFISKLGRRKSWLIPSQYLTGFLLLLISWNFDEWMGDEDQTRPPNLRMLIITCFLCNCMSATQDVAVDGWSLTMLRKENVGHSGTCSGIGYAFATLLGNTLFICLDSKNFCNRWLRVTPQPVGLVPFSHFIFFWAMVFFLATTLILFFKKDNSLSVVEDANEINLNLTESFSLFWKIFKIKRVQLICLALMTVRVGFAAAHAVTPLKLIDAGVNKDSISTLNVPLVVLQIIMPLTIQRFIVGGDSLTGFIGIIPYRIIIDIVLAVLVYFLPLFKVDKIIPMWYWILLMTAFGLEQMAQYMMQLIEQAYFSKISDARFGGTYLTLLNTVNNFGSRWPISVALFFVDGLTWRKCPQKGCEIIVDGYYIETAIGVATSLAWYIWAKHKVLPLEKLSDSSWAVNQPRKTKKFKTGISAA